MDEIVVPIDITGEEKSVLAIFSLRQFFFVAPAAVLTFVFLLWGRVPFIGGIAGLIVRSAICLIVDLFVAACAFLKIERYEQYLSEFLVTQFHYRKSQKTYF